MEQSAAPAGPRPEPSVFPPTPSQERPPVVTWTAIWWYINAGTYALGVLGFLAAAVTFALARQEGAAILAGTFFAVAAVLLLFAILYLVAGIYLMRMREWARILSIILAAIGLLAFPVGTIIGIIILIYITKPEVSATFH